MENPDFLLNDPDFLLRNPDFLLKNADFIINQVVDETVTQAGRRQREADVVWCTLW